MSGVRSARPCVLIGLVAIGACADAPTEPTPNPPAPFAQAPPTIIAVQLRDEPVPLTRTVSAWLDSPGRLEVRYGSEGLPELRVVDGRARGMHDVTLARLYPDRTYWYEVKAVDMEGGSGEVWSGQFQTDPLPDDLARLQLRVEGVPTHPLTMLEITRSQGFTGWVVVDGQGRIVWYYRARGGANGSVRRRDRTLALIDEGRGLLHLAPSGRVLGEVPQDSANRRIHHDVIEAPNGALWFIAQDWRAARDTVVAAEAIWEWRPESGAPRRLWTAWDHLDPELDWGAVSTAGDWLHANAISLGPRGNVVMSMHYLNTALSIAPGFGSVEWRLGGPGTPATITTSAEDRFSGQHTVVEIAPDRVLMFDNGFERLTDRHSRAVEFALDRAGGRAEKVWEWRAEPDIWARIVGLARRLPNGNTFVVFGAGPGFLGSTGPVSAHEVRPDGTVGWRLSVEAVSILYRAWPLDDLASEEPTG
jgi:hypothetical protein